MPTYEYECSKCSFRFEVKRSFNEIGGSCCPRCGSEGRQLYSSTPLIFKGSGFYVTDSRKTADRSPVEGQPAKPETGKPARKMDADKPQAQSASDSSSPKTEAGKAPSKSESGK
jgi:putative FmdB family regulatory protein